MNIKIFLKFSFAAFPVLFIFGLLEIFDMFGTQLTVMLLVGINLLLACFLYIILKTEGSISAPMGIGEIVKGTPYIISISGTLITLFIFLLALNKAVG